MIKPREAMVSSGYPGWKGTWGGSPTREAAWLHRRDRVRRRMCRTGRGRRNNSAMLATVDTVRLAKVVYRKYTEPAPQLHTVAVCASRPAVRPGLVQWLEFDPENWRRLQVRSNTAPLSAGTDCLTRTHSSRIHARDALLVCDVVQFAHGLIHTSSRRFRRVRTHARAQGKTSRSTALI